MKTNYTYHSLSRLIVLVFSGILIISCGTSRHADFEDNDGIYSSTIPSTTETTQEPDNRNYYKQYFQAKKQVYAQEPEDDLIFTDVEGYTSTEAYVDEDGIIHEEMAYEEPYGPWGDETTSVTVNIYNSPGYGYYSWHRPHWWYTGGWGISYWYWSGYYTPYWSWSYPHYWTGWSSPYYNPYYYNPYYYNPYYGGYSNYVSYNRGRRNTNYVRSTRTTTRTNNTQVRSSRDYSRSEIERRINNSRSNQTIRNSSQRTRTDASRTNPSVNRNSTIRQSNTPTRSSNTRTTTRPSSNTRSSGTINRGGSSVRSSGSSGSRSSSSSSRRGGGF